jgi:hypothetical protein
VGASALPELPPWAAHASQTRGARPERPTWQWMIAELLEVAQAPQDGGIRAAISQGVDTAHFEGAAGAFDLIRCLRLPGEVGLRVVARPLREKVGRLELGRAARDALACAVERSRDIPCASNRPLGHDGS